jgi:hypothetical protein
MNAAATPNITADIELGGQVDYLVPIAIGLAVGGVLVLVGAIAVILTGIARHRPNADWGAALVDGVGRTNSPTTPFVAHPLRLEGHLDPDLSRWKWLVKWVLAIPHFVVLLFAWIAFAVLTIVAFFAVAFIGRYPRRIFDFNVGVMRWSWRVAFYATSVVGTDRYPPFTLKDTDYPARLDVAYPARLSRRLVLVKSWLLAIPHLLIVCAFTGGWGPDTDWGFVFSDGLLGLVGFIAALGLLFTGRYPVGLFNLIMGMMRWVHRVIVYVVLMTDHYPPFRLDQGGSEPPVAASPLANAALSPLPNGVRE